MTINSEDFYRFQPSILLQFEVHLAEHCNLNCKNCNHYAPIAKEEFLDVEEYERDCSRLSELFGSEASQIRLMGGEPRLHPEICDIMEITRKKFKYGNIMLVTNGILLEKQEGRFWDVCRDVGADIGVTEYPIHLDYDKLKELTKQNGVNYHLFGNGYREKMWRFPIDIRGMARPEKNFYHCFAANNCVTLKHGKLYTCMISAHAHHLADFFHLDISLSERNGIDIYKAESAEEIQTKLVRPIPFCRYCDFGCRDDYMDDYQASIRDRYEWISFQFTKEDFQYLRERSTVYIYGAGSWGAKALSRLKAEGIQVEALIVSSMLDDVSELDGVEVKPVDAVERPDSESVCLIAVNGKAKIEIQHRLYEKGFRRIIPIMHM